MIAKPAHADLIQFPIKDDELIIGGMPVSALAEQVGQTPFYAYDRSAISARISSLRSQLPDAILLHYAIKANPMPAVVDHVATLVDGLDVASGGELQIALNSSVSPKNISFAGPGKTDQELRASIDADIVVNVESRGELERLATLAVKVGRRPRVAVRVNPAFELKSSGMKMTGGAKPFGIDAELVPAALARIGELDLEFVGLHIFSGSQNLNAQAIVEAQNATFDLALGLSNELPAPMSTLNIGGGLGIPYFPGEKRLDLTPIADNLSSLIEQYVSRLGQPDIIMELGRYLVGEAGVYVCEVVDRKVSRGVTFLVTNGGLNHHLAATGNFGQLVRKNYPVIHARQVREGIRETVDVVGPLCTPLDILAENLEIGQAQPGDLIGILQSGAYGFSASPHGFLGHRPPAEILV